MKTILVIEKDPTLCGQIKEALSGLFTVKTSENCFSGITLCEEECPDLIIAARDSQENPIKDTRAVLQERYGYLIPVLYVDPPLPRLEDTIRRPFSASELVLAAEKLLTEAESPRSNSVDDLTGFLLHSAAAAKLTEVCKKHSGILMMLDLDHMKSVNESFGHKMGDIMLKCFAEILRSSVHEGDIIGRMDGDEFIVFCKGERDDHAVSLITEQLNRELLSRAKLYMGSDMTIPIGVSLGAVLVPEHGTDFNSLYQLADKALYTVKQEGRHGFYIHGSGDTDIADKFSASAATLRSLDCTFEERSSPGRALWVGKEAFTQIYRFFLRYISSYSGIGHKLLFTLSSRTDSNTFTNATDLFGDMLARVLRKSDMMVRLRQDQYFLLIPNIKPGDFETLVGRLLTAWSREKCADALEISYEAAMIATAGPGTGNRRQGDKKKPE